MTFPLHPTLCRGGGRRLLALPLVLGAAVALAGCDRHKWTLPTTDNALRAPSTAADAPAATTPQATTDRSTGHATR